MGDVGDIVKKYGIRSVLLAVLIATIIWVLAHCAGSPGKQISVLWGLVTYTKQDSAAFATPPEREREPREKIVGKTFSREPVHLDGKSFIDCRFDGSELIYSGTGPVELKYNAFKGPKWTFSGAAGSTVGFLRALRRDEGTKALFEDIFSRPDEEIQPHKN